MTQSTGHTTRAIDAMMLDAAVWYAEEGIAVFPIWPAEGDRCGCRALDCDRPGKHPIASCAPNGFKSATTDVEAITRWWTLFPKANIATPTDWCTVLDVDPRHGGDEALAELECECGPLPRTRTAKTGGGGRHLYFQAVAGLRCSSGKVGRGLDIKAAGGYVLLPPSNHVSGGRYEWL